MHEIETPRLCIRKTGTKNGVAKDAVFWEMRLKAGGEVVGRCRLAWLSGDGKRVVEVGWSLTAECQHKGYAAEAVKGCLDYVFEKLAVEKVIATIDGTNVAAMNVAIRCGMTIERLLQGDGSDAKTPRYVFAARNPNAARRSACPAVAPAVELPAAQVDSATDVLAGGGSQTAELEPSGGINKYSPPDAKIALFMSLFGGRPDMYALRRYSRRHDNAYYMSACRNEYVPGICGKPKQKCGACKNRDFLPFDAEAVRAHLMNQDENGHGIIGVYPLLADETCRFLALDFDGDGWMKDVAAVRTVCDAVGMPCVVERSRSGKGAHLWFFFERPIPAATARRLGSLLVTQAMARRHEIRFASYDRMFPNQDTLPKGGFGNLIALPLQGGARRKGNSVFVDADFEPHPDPWAFLSGVERLSPERVEALSKALDTEGELGAMEGAPADEADAPWLAWRPPPNLSRDDFPDVFRCVEGNRLFVQKRGLSQRAMNRIRRLAAFPNPAFHAKQRMRMSTFGVPRVVCVADETERWIALPRGTRPALEALAEGAGVEPSFEDQRETGQPLAVRFTGKLRMDQAFAVDALASEDDGVLAAATAFGKTVAAIALIARLGRSTLVLVHTLTLLAQWKRALARFLVDEASGGAVEVGQLGGGVNTLNGRLDIASVQSLGNEAFVQTGGARGYGVVVVDECHHVPALTIARALGEMDARRIYGLTATPIRKDGLQPLIFMHCGPIRYRAESRSQAGQGGARVILPRMTRFKKYMEVDEEAPGALTQILRDMVEDEERNRLVVADAVKALGEGRSPLVLTQRTEHVGVLAGMLRREVDAKVFELVGSATAKTKRERTAEIAAVGDGEPMVVVATGQYVGEGFDLPRLDTLLLAMPVSWRGLVAQYAGRLHREHPGKRAPMIYDYVDVHVGVLERMHQRRLKAYAQIGYCTAPAEGEITGGNVIFDTGTFASVMRRDFQAARERILIVSPFIRRRRADAVFGWLQPALARGVSIEIVTRPPGGYRPEAVRGIADCIENLRQAGVVVTERAQIHQKFVVVDGRLVWYGSLNLLSYGTSEESLMRLSSRDVAGELEASLK
jgi:superfamily II DNA or RNA helicase